jgi:hypothetical protein
MLDTLPLTSFAGPVYWAASSSCLIHSEDGSYSMCLNVGTALIDNAAEFQNQKLHI